MSKNPVTYNSVVLKFPDGKPLEAGDIHPGDLITFEFETGTVLKVEWCTYPNCDCAVSFPEGYKPSEETECPKLA